ncbi:MAG: MaoC family dehydratase N-terminal domain-containing protein [Euryarchaeota archaeon]|nr:MaoC family dehydratase N-terminal domain-containing protein [Euryarchaeota archaeon]
MPTWDQVKEGDAVTPLVKGPIHREEIKAYGTASGDTNPIHMDEKMGVAMGLGGVIQHGLRSMAFVSQMLTDWAGSPHALKKIDVQFRGMVRPGDTVTSTAKITRKYQANQQKLVDVDILQEARSPVGKGTITQFEGVQVEWEEAAFRGWLKGGDTLIYEPVKEEKGADKKNRIEFKLYRTQNSILGKATVILP